MIHQIHFSFFVRSFVMVVRTRSSGTSAVVVAPVVAPVARAPRRAARFATPSYTDASLRSYKIYTPKRRPVRGVVAEESEPELGSENDAVEAAEALASMNYASEASEVYEAPIPAAAAAGPPIIIPVTSCITVKHGRITSTVSSRRRVRAVRRRWRRWRRRQENHHCPSQPTRFRPDTLHI